MLLPLIFAEADTSISMEVFPTIRVIDVKNYIAEEMDLDTGRFILKYEGDILRDVDLLFDCGITAESSVEV